MRCESVKGHHYPTPAFRPAPALPLDNTHVTSESFCTGACSAQHFVKPVKPTKSQLLTMSVDSSLAFQPFYSFFIFSIFLECIFPSFSFQDHHSTTINLRHHHHHHHDPTVVYPTSPFSAAPRCSLFSVPRYPAAPISGADRAGQQRAGAEETKHPDGQRIRFSVSIQA
jgi:hypothetical protein